MVDDELAPFLEKARLRKGGIVLALLCAVLASVAFLEPDASAALRFGVLIPFGSLALVFLYMAFRSPNKHRFIRTLRERRQDIVWVYIRRHIVNGVLAQNYLDIGLVDGTSATLGIGKTGEGELLARAVALVPHATSGHSSELEATFKRDPRSLLRR